MCAICPSREQHGGQIGKISVCPKCYNLYAVRGNEKMMIVAMDQAIESDERLVAARKQIERLEKLRDQFFDFIDQRQLNGEWLRYSSQE